MSKGRQNKNLSNKIKMFSVPFNLSDIEGDIKINTIGSTENLFEISKEEIITKAIQLHVEGNIPEARKYYEYCLKQDFKDYRIFSNYGLILKDLGKLKEAELSIRKAIKINPFYSDAYSNLGNLLRQLGKHEEAELSMRKAIEFNSNLTNAQYNLGSLLIEHQRLKEAEVFIRKSIKLKPEFADAHASLGVILFEYGNLREAEISTRKAIELRPNYAEYYSNLGGILNAIGKSKEAEIVTREAIKIKPDFVKAHIELGEILFKLGKTEEASISQWKAIKLNPAFEYMEDYRKNSKLLSKTAFYVYSQTVYTHFKPILEINPRDFEILVPHNVNKELLNKIHDDLNKDIKIRSINELIEKNLIYEKLISNLGDHEYQIIQDNKKIQVKRSVPIIKLLGKQNIRFMYTAGKNKYTIYSYWNKYYDGILCYGPYHEEKFKLNHQVYTSQMGYPRFDKYYNPGFKIDNLLRKFKCDPTKQTIVWLTTWSKLSSVDKYLKAISSLTEDYNIVVRPHPHMKENDPDNYKKLFTVNFNYIDDTFDDNVQLYALADLMFFDYGGPMFGSLYLNKNFAFLDMHLESKNNKYLGDSSSEEYLKSFFPDRIANLDNLKSICTYCLNNPPSNSILKSLREEFFNTNYRGNSSKRAYDLLLSNNWLCD